MLPTLTSASTKNKQLLIFNHQQSDGAPKCVFTRRRANLRNPVYSYVARRAKNRQYWFLSMTRGGKVKRKTMPWTVSDRGKNSGGFKFYELNVTRTTTSWGAWTRGFSLLCERRRRLAGGTCLEATGVNTVRKDRYDRKMLLRKNVFFF